MVEIGSMELVYGRGTSTMEVGKFVHAMLRHGISVTVRQSTQNKFNPLPFISASAVGIGERSETVRIAGEQAAKLIRLARKSPDRVLRSLAFGIRNVRPQRRLDINDL